MKAFLLCLFVLQFVDCLTRRGRYWDRRYEESTRTRSESADFFAVFFQLCHENPTTDKLSMATNQVWANAYVGHTPAHVDLLDSIVRDQELEVTWRANYPKCIGFP